MGASQSVSQTSQVSNSVKCKSLSNDHTAYIAKQIGTLYQAYKVLDEFIANKDKINYEKPENYLVDTSFVLQDLHILDTQGNPMVLETTGKIFDPKPRTIGIVAGRPISKLYTILDEYNDFFLNQHNFSKDQLVTLKTKIYETLFNGLDVLVSNCGDIAYRPNKLNVVTDSAGNTVVVDTSGNPIVLDTAGSPLVHPSGYLIARDQSGQNYLVDSSGKPVVGENGSLISAN